MVPEQLNTEIVIDDSIQPSKTYYIDHEKGRIIGNIDGMDAINQYIRKVFKTERFRYLIYNSEFGIELEKFLIGNYSEELLKIELVNVIMDALNDNRITSLDDFNPQFEKDKAYVEFVANTIFGKANVKEVVEFV